MLGSRCPSTTHTWWPPRCAGSSAAALRSHTTVIRGWARSSDAGDAGLGASSSIDRSAVARVEPVARTSSSRAFISVPRPTVSACSGATPSSARVSSLRRTTRVGSVSRDPGSSNATCPSFPRPSTARSIGASSKRRSWRADSAVRSAALPSSRWNACSWIPRSSYASAAERLRGSSEARPTYSSSASTVAALLGSSPNRACARSAA